MHRRGSAPAPPEFIESCFAKGVVPVVHLDWSNAHYVALYVREADSISPTWWIYLSVRVALKLRNKWLFHP